MGWVIIFFPAMVMASILAVAYATEVTFHRRRRRRRRV